MTEKRTTYLIEKYLSNSISRRELDELQIITQVAYPGEDWRNAIDDLMADLSSVDLPDLPGKASNIEDIMVKVKTEHSPYHRSKKSKFQYWLVAASVLILLGIGFVYQAEILQPKLQITEAQKGKIMMLTLTDSTQIFLQSGSKIKYPKVFAENERKVKLYGEAFFKVTKNPEKPFIVKSDDVEVTVLGTSFNIRSNNQGSTEITVATGRVKVKNPSSQLILNPDEQALSGPDKDLILKKNVDADLYTSWKDETVQFNNISMGEAMEILSRRFSVELKIVSPGLEKCLVRAEYNRRSLQSILESLRFISNIEYHYVNEKTVEISGKACK